MGLQLAYHRMPGPGDLPGLGAAYSRNDPATDEPAFGLDDAAANVAARLVDAGDAGELVETVANAAAALGWIAQEVVVPAHLRQSFAGVLELAERLRREVDAEYEALNAPALEVD